MLSTHQPIRYTLTTDQVVGGDMQHEPILCVDFKTIVLQLIAAPASGLNASFTVKVEGSQDPIDALPTNWSFIDTVEYNNTSNSYVGTTGYIFATNGIVLLELNTNRLTWMKITISTYVSGKLNASVTLSQGI